MTDEQAEKLGQALIHLLGLCAKRNGRIDTAHGDKTPIGLGRTVLRVVEEELADTRQESEPLNPNEPPFGRPK
jgi:hypothetical protein